MKIKSIELQCSSPTQIKLGSTDFALVICKPQKGSDKQSSAILITRGGRQLLPQHTAHLSAVVMSLSSADKQYIASLGISAGVAVPLRDDHALLTLLRCIKEHSQRMGRTSGEFCELTVRAAFAAVGDELTSGRESFEGADIPHYSELLSIRESVYDFPENIWNASECAAELGISRAYFHRLYLKAFGVTFLSDVMESRLISACELLERTELSVCEIAEKCGYESDSYFMRQFRKYRGCTPTEYRRRAMK